MQSEAVRFIATSTSFLKRLQSVQWKNRSSLSFEVRGQNILLLETGIEFTANDVQGEGVFYFDIHTINRLINCLKTLTEQPLVFTFRDHTILTIQHIMF